MWATLDYLSPLFFNTTYIITGAPTSGVTAFNGRGVVLLANWQTRLQSSVTDAPRIIVEGIR